MELDLENLDGFFEESVETVNMDDLTAKVESSILSILKSAHSDQRKHQFHKRAKSIQFPCPICGDSATDSTKMRGHIYLAYGLYKCYNNNNCSGPIAEFFGRFGFENLFTNAELSELQKIAVNTRAELYTARQSISLLEEDEVSPHLFTKQEIIEYFDAIEVSKDYYAKSKIADRCIPESKYDRLMWVPDKQYLLILNIHEQSGKVINIVKRQMRPKFTGPKYMTVTYSELLSIKHGLRTAYVSPEVAIQMKDIADKAEMLEEAVKKLDITCQYYNVLNVDWNADIYVFEGPIDSFFMPNSMALSGTGADMKHSTFLYVFDDDGPGRKEAYKRLDHREPVFMWKKFLDENQIYKKPYVQKRDFNDIWKIKPFDVSLMRQYFTDNPLYKLYV